MAECRRQSMDKVKEWPRKVVRTIHCFYTDEEHREKTIEVDLMLKKAFLVSRMRLELRKHQWCGVCGIARRQDSRGSSEREREREAFAVWICKKMTHKMTTQ